MAQILLAEDDDSMREFLAKALRRAGHEVVPVGDGLDALAQLSELPFDLLLADVVMPGLDGIELARRATKKQPGIKVMFITGFAAVRPSRCAHGSRAPRTPGSCPSRSICAIWSIRSASCSRPPEPPPKRPGPRLSRRAGHRS
jgi:two-component system cell cycle response regulator CpdR